MAGIGKYTKGKAFTLKSGNAPAFKMMAGDSPITKDFGIGEGTSPYKAEVKTSSVLPVGSGSDADADKAAEEAAAAEVTRKSKKWHKGGGNRVKQVGLTLLSGALGGLNAAYGNKEAKSKTKVANDNKDEEYNKSIIEQYEKEKADAKVKADAEANKKAILAKKENE